MQRCNVALDGLCLSFSPLFALRIDLRECETFDLGTARTNGGKSSSSDCREGNVHVRDAARSAGTAVNAKVAAANGGRRAKRGLVNSGSTPWPASAAIVVKKREERANCKLKLRRDSDRSIKMLRLTRPLFQALRSTTGLTGLAVHPDPLPALTNTYQATLTQLTHIPETSVYRQATEALIKNKLDILKAANTDVAAAEKALGEGIIEESILIAVDELKLAAQMVDWQA
jgi:NADH dehydrogenase (ubiquinone) 1 alpha subcomplex subunit 5